MNFDNFQPYTVDQYYTVPTVEAQFFQRRDIWPVLGPKHEDAEFINFPKSHYHFDFRFFSVQQWDYILESSYSFLDEWRIFAQVLQALHADKPLPPVVMRRRKCLRPMPDYVPASKIPWRAALAAAYADKTLVDGHICPHRGASLRGIAPDGDGCVTCPLHGLRFDVTTGKAVAQ